MCPCLRKNVDELCLVIMSGIMHITRPWKTWKIQFDDDQRTYIVKWKENPHNQTWNGQRKICVRKIQLTNYILLELIAIQDVLLYNTSNWQNTVSSEGAKTLISKNLPTILVQVVICGAILYSSKSF